MKKKIYLSGPGLVCCAGQNRNELYESCLNGFQGGMVMHELPGSPEADGSSVTYGSGKKFPAGLVMSELPDIDTLPVSYTWTKCIKLINAALEQMRDEIEKAIALYGKERIGVCLGSCDNGSETSLTAHRAFFEKGAFPGGYSLSCQSASFPAEFIARKFALKGPVLTAATACASGASAIVRGSELIRADFCDAVIAGGVDVVSDTVFLGFHALEALSDSLCNPLSKNRKGINLGEGAAFFLMDTSRNSAIELLGTGESSDAWHMTAPGTDGAGPAKAMRAALLDSGLEPEQIGYINLHGTGTPLNDSAEALAVKTVFGETVPPVSSTKPITGHTLGAAGALEAAICWMVLNEKKGLPVHCWDGERDEEIPWMPLESVQKNPSVCMSNSFAFGGCNVSLILGDTGNEGV